MKRFTKWVDSPSDIERRKELPLNENNLHGYQHTGVDHIITNTHSALLLEMGLG